MKQLLKISEMMPFLPTALKDAIHHVAKDTGNKTDDLELHRHTHSEKAKVNELDPTSRKSLAYVSYRTQDRDDEIVIPQSLKLDEFRKYASVLVNHNYSLLPVGSDEMIEADDYGIKALTVHADTGAGTMANVVWDLVRQGHLKGRSVGFVPTSYTKPGARDWDHVANQLQSNWKEFDKGRAEKSVSRIITGGVLLEHSFVSVPCNTDAELIGVVKSMRLDGKIIKQLGLEEKQEKVPSVCDECGYVADAVPGSKCPECKTGDMKPKTKEKAIEVRAVSKGGAGSGNFGHAGRPGEVGGSGSGDGGGKGLTEAETKAVEEIIGVHKAMGIPCTCDECGAEDECAPGSPCQEDECEGVMRASKKMEKEYSPVITVVKPAPSVKVLYVPPDAELIVKGVSTAIEHALARRTGKIM